MFATLTSKRANKRTGAAISFAALVVAVAWQVGPAAALDLPCGAPVEMFNKGLDSYKASRYEIAIPAFECVLRKDDGLQKFHAEFYLARILSDDTGGFADHAKAYTLFQGIADTVDRVDGEDVRRAPFVAKSLTAVATYVRRGLPAIGLKPDTAAAVDLLTQAANLFNEPDAQFELAKMQLTGDGVPANTPLALHYIAKLVQDSHAGAQAFLADLHWRGIYAPQVPKDRARALALIKLAVENASPSDRLWVEDAYQNIYCGTPAAERQQATDVTARLRKVFARSLNSDRAQLGPALMGLGRREPSMGRTCGNNEPVDMELRGAIVSPPLASSLTQSGAQAGPQQTLPAGMRTPPR